MIEDNYRFDTMAPFQRDLLITWTFTISIWFGLPTFSGWGYLKLEDYFSLPVLIFPGFMFILFFITWFWRRGIFYEVSSTKLVKRWGKHILRSVKLSDVQGIIGKYPIRLKITDQRDFIFDDIGIFSSYRKLRSLLQELGITKIKTKVSKLEIIRRLLIVLFFLVAAYFAFSIVIMWYLGGLYFPHLYSREDPIDWVMFLHAIPAVVLFCASIAALIFAHKQRIRMSFITLGLVLGISVLCFFIETTNNLFQAFYPFNATGDINSTTRIGGRHLYWNWWWWHDNVVDYSYLFPNVTYKYGCIDKTGRIVAEPQFDKVYGFSESMARIELDDKYGYIDTNGAIRVKPNLDDARNFHEGLAAVEIEDKWAYIDKRGKFVIEPAFDSAYDFSEGLASVKIGTKWGYINQKGEIVIKCKFDWAEHFKEGLASVEIDDKDGFINTKGEFVIEPQFDHAHDFSEGLAAVTIDDKCTYIDKTGQIRTERRFLRAMDFSDGLAAVNIGGKYGYINKDGHIVIKCQYYYYDVYTFSGQYYYEEVCPFSDGIALVCRHNGKWGYRSSFIFSFIKQNGEIVTDLKFSRAHRFSEGLTSIANEDGYWGYVDTKGEVVIRPRFDVACPFSEGIATVGVKIAKEGNHE